MLDKHSLNFAFESGILDENEIRLQIEMYEREYYLKMHKKRIWQDKTGAWLTWLPDITNPEGRRRLRRVSLEKLKDDIAYYYKETANEPRIEDVFQEWVEQKLKYGEIQKQTYDRYTLDFKKYFKDSPLKTMLFRHITEDILEDFIKSTIHDQELTAKAWGSLRILINGIFRYGKKKGYTGLSISSFMGDLDLSRRAFKRRIFTPEESVFQPYEVKMIEEYLADTSSVIGLGILLAFETGLRVGELCTLKPSDIDFKHKVMTVRRTEVRYKDENGSYVFDVADGTKGRDGIRRVLLTERAVYLLHKIRRINPFTEYLFTSQKSGSRLNGKYFSSKLVKICKILGIRPRSMHKVRKTYASKLLSHGVTDQIVMAQLGHTDITTTRRFYYFNQTSDEEALEILEKASAI